ncbi:MAG: hypothetical protein KGR98_00020 [Verrucomicrobia bacterium]|nr:hypothetical protein [Verrucomicrobiota bacterium]MDE3098167.1 hypothetical protein [Verrucomicrobiota bacterium]
MAGKWRLKIWDTAFWNSVLPLAALSAMICVSCRTVQPLPPADLAAPGWRVLHGQAVWTPPDHRPELVGDLVLATNDNGNFFIQFSKTPFVLATAEVENGQWEIQFGAGKFAWRGSGRPSDRFLWFQLPPALGGAALPDDWQFERGIDNMWRLKNPRTGETLQGEFFP